MLTDFITSEPQSGGPITLEALESNMRAVWDAVGPSKMATTITVKKSTYKMIKQWERSRVMRYERGVPVLGKRFRIVRSRWKVIQHQS